MDEVLPLQVLHGGGDLRSHIEQHHCIDLLPETVPQVVQQVAVGHELCDDVEGRLACAHTCGGQSLTHTHTCSYTRARLIKDF